MPPILSAEHRSWPLATPFRISRGVKESAEVVVVSIREGERTGRGEGAPYARYAPKASYVEPAVLSEGVDHLFVNGVPMIDAGRAADALAGRVIRHRPPAGTCP
ncbi:hypothetical protein [Luteimonas sp. R10]|uniref:hypothetical protein n=1 Tax=Luteimonas sp. R10 TaxID=3108176 RepID=UPI003085D8B4|nr:hypothetical protein U3649_00810 [Luteimonas sp. R10]